MKKVLIVLVAVLMALVPSLSVAESVKAPIVLQGAMDCESQLMMDALENPVDESIGGYHFVTGTLNGYPVVVIKTQVGMVNSATVTTLAIERYKPLCVINQGTAGGHDPALHQWDIVLGESVSNINSFKSAHLDDGAGMAPETWEWMLTETYIDGEWKDNDALKSDEALLKIAQGVAYEKGSLVTGVIGSGDVWNKEIDRIQLIHDAFNTSCEEMETYAAAQVCNMLNVPFLGIRVLSNSELHAEEFDYLTALACQEYVLNVARAIIAAQ